MTDYNDHAILNVTHGGLSHDLDSPVPVTVTDDDVRRIAAECLSVALGTFVNYVVDRFNTPQGGHRLYLRPKVPFGADQAPWSWELAGDG